MLQWGGILYIFLYNLCPRLQAMRESFTAAGQLPPRLGPVQLTKGMRGRKEGLEILRGGGGSMTFTCPTYVLKISVMAPGPNCIHQFKNAENFMIALAIW